MIFSGNEKCAAPSYGRSGDTFSQKRVVTLVVGLAGFEPTTSSPPVKRATKLRHSPLPYSLVGNEN